MICSGRQAARKLIKVLSAVTRATETRDLLVLDGELVVVCYLFAYGDRLLRVNDDLGLSIHRYDFGVTVGLKFKEYSYLYTIFIYPSRMIFSTYITAMVDEPGEISALGRIHDVVEVDPEEVTGADTLLLVTLLSHVREDGPHVVSDVLDDHLVGGNVLEGEEAPIVNGRLSKGHLLPTELKWAKENCVSDESVAAAFHISLFDYAP